MSNWRKAAYTSTVLLTILTLAILFPISFKSADNLAEATAGTAQDSIITLSATKPTASVSLNVTSTSGSTATSKTGATQGETDERATFTVATNNAKGYKLSIKSSSGTTLTNGTDTLDAIGTSGITLDTFSTNTWGYLPSYYNNTANSTLYYPITTSDVVLRETNTATSTDGVSNPDTYTIALGLKADYTKSAGTYTNDNIVLTAIANPTPYTTTYDKGDATGTPSNMPGTNGDTVSNPQTGAASDTSVTLSSKVPELTGYDFTGWCLGTISTTNNVDSCTGTGAKTFQPGATFGIDRTLASNTATLHAMWSIKAFTLTVQNGGNTTVNGSGTYQYGQTVTITATPTTNTTCTSYGTPTWTKTSGEGTLNSASGTSVTFTMGLGNATVTATSTASNVAQTVTLSKGTGVSGINIGGTNYTGTSASLNCGSYAISGNYSSGYEFSSWAVASNVSVASTSSASTTLTVSGAGTLTLNAKSSGYTISYNANGGSGSIASQEVSQGSSITLADNAFTRSNYYFKGWATSSGGSVTYRTNQSITPTGNMTLYAVWGSSTGTTLYNIVASLTRGNQTNNTNATTGIKTKPTKANSGVWTYNASTFGTASDADTTNAIYYYRGILDAIVGSYGSDGDSMDYPNYVKLGVTCWRIVRTTGSGGVKMVYNGMYGNTVSGSCANATEAAQIRSTSATTADSTATFTSVFNSSAGDYHSIVGVGYTKNNTYVKSTATTATAYSTLFGTNSNYSGNSTNSTIKGNIETWFTNNLNSYASKLEASAGYCNDRTLYPDGSYATSNLISDSTTIVPYGTSSMTVYYFGAYARNLNSAQSPTLTCPRSTVDLYTTSSASNGNKQLSKPVALLTADEVSFAGSGSTTASQGSGYNSNSYLRSGSQFWLLSPYYRKSDGIPYAITLRTGGTIYYYHVLSGFGVRPAISLVSGTKPASGSGTATDPWVVQ